MNGSLDRRKLFEYSMLVGLRLEESKSQPLSLFFFALFPPGPHLPSMLIHPNICENVYMYMCICVYVYM